MTLATVYVKRYTIHVYVQVHLFAHAQNAATEFMVNKMLSLVKMLQLCLWLKY